MQYLAVASQMILASTFNRTGQTGTPFIVIHVSEGGMGRVVNLEETDCVGIGD